MGAIFCLCKSNNPSTSLHPRVPSNITCTHSLRRAIDLEAKAETGGAVTLWNSCSYYEQESVKVSVPESPWSVRKKCTSRRLDFRRKLRKSKQRPWR
jgi:hypothetical protein